ncbi:MAG: DUF305 domain-containing protein [Patescibacteria group bacterium]
MNTKTLLIALGTLVVGFGIGYGVWGHAAMPARHMMPDGSMMDANGGTVDMSSMMHDMNAALEGKNGDAFDREFLAQMIVHHEGAVAMAELSAAQAKHQEIKDLSNGIIAAQQKEIAMMKAWQSAWYK